MDVRFPPEGDRSLGDRRPIELHGRGYAEGANKAVKLICQIEPPEALANIRAAKGGSPAGEGGLY